MALYDYKTIQEELRTYWASRKMALLKLWDFYYGDRQRYYLAKFEGESEQEYYNRILDATIENHCAKTCDTLVGYLYGQPNSRSRTIVRVIDKEGEIIEDAQRFLRDRIWVYNKIDVLRIAVALMTSVTGTGIVRNVFVDTRTRLPFKPNASKEDKKKYGMVRYDLYDTVDTMPLPLMTEDGDIYPQILGAIVRYYERDNFTGITPLDRLLNKAFTASETLEVYSGEKFVRATLEHGAIDAETVRQAGNPYKDITTVFTLFKNHGDPMYLEGNSDLSQMTSLQNTLNEISNADKLTIDYHSFPLLVLMGGAKLPSNFIRKVNSGLELDVNQDVKYLTWDNVLEASDVYKEGVRKQMTVVSGVSQISRGNATDIGQVRSGAGLKTLFQADVNAIGLKVPYFAEAERQLVLSTLKMWEIETGESFGEDVRVEVKFPEDFVGLDELLKAQTEQLEIANRTKTVEELIKDKHPDLVSEDEVDEILEESIEELEDTTKASAPPMAPGMKPGTTPEAKSMEQQKPK